MSTWFDMKGTVRFVRFLLVTKMFKNVLRTGHERSRSIFGSVRGTVADEITQFIFLNSNPQTLLNGDGGGGGISKFNGTSTPKGSYSAKTGVNCTMNLSRVY